MLSILLTLSLLTSLTEDECVDVQWFLKYTDVTQCQQISRTKFNADNFTRMIHFKNKVMILNRIPASPTAPVFFAVNYTTNKIIINLKLASRIKYRDSAIAAGEILTIALDLDTNEVAWVDTTIRFKEPTEKEQDPFGNHK